MTRFEDRFAGSAAGYAAMRPGYPAALLDLLVRLAPRRRLAWEAGCGSGQLSVSLADRFDRVIATDASAAQLAHAPRPARVAYQCAMAEHSPIRSGVVDLSIAAQAAHWFDLPAYWTEVRRVGRADAVVALVSYGLVATGDAALDAALRDFHERALAGHWAPQRRHVDSGYRTLEFPFAEIATPALELRERWPLARLLGYVETWSGVRALERAEGRASIDAFRAEITEAWGAPGSLRTLRWPLTVRAGRAG
ncbi:MAG: methyltransferase domain-containing protein [Longimicrobiales bacterium]